MGAKDWELFSFVKFSGFSACVFKVFLAVMADINTRERKVKVQFIKYRK